MSFSPQSEAPAIQELMNYLNPVTWETLAEEDHVEISSNIKTLNAQNKNLNMMCSNMEHPKQRNLILALKLKNSNPYLSLEP